MGGRYQEGFVRGHAKALLDSETAYRELLDAADEVLGEREAIKTAAEARLALLIHATRPTYIGGRENCTCEERETCDECQPVASILTALESLAGDSSRFS